MMMQQRFFFLCSAMTAVMLLFAVQTASAQWSLIDDFEAYTLGSDIDGQGGWTANGGNAGNVEVAMDPAGGTNQTLQFAPDSDSSEVFHGINIPNANSASTVFFRARRDGVSNMSWGTSDASTPGAFGDFETQLNIQHGNPSELNVRDGGSFDAVDTMAADVWHDFWMVIDNADDTYEAYMDDGSGITQLDAGTQTTFDFRNGAAANDLVNLFMLPSGNHDANFYFDDIFLDTSGQNLTNPTVAIPEPATIAMWSLLGLAVGAFALIRRRGAK